MNNIDSNGLNIKIKKIVVSDELCQTFYPMCIELQNRK